MILILIPKSERFVHSDLNQLKSNESGLIWSCDQIQRAVGIRISFARFNKCQLQIIGDVCCKIQHRLLYERVREQKLAPMQPSPVTEEQLMHTFSPIMI